MRVVDWGRTPRQGPVAASLLCLALSGAAAQAQAPSPAGSRAAPTTLGVGALGQLGPRGGVLRVAGPSEWVKVLGELRVAEGDTLRAGQIIGLLDDIEQRRVEVVRMEAVLRSRLANAQKLDILTAQAREEDERIARLFDEGLVSLADRDGPRYALAAAISQQQVARQDVDVAEADLAAARVVLARRTIRSPVGGRVVAVHARAGEQIDSKGIVDIVPTGSVVATAEVYENDIGRIHLGQRARVASPVLGAGLAGTVSRIASQVGRRRLQDTDPAAPRDVRVVEVEVTLDDSAAAEPFTGLTVNVRFED